MADVGVTKCAIQSIVVDDTQRRAAAKRSSEHREAPKVAQQKTLHINTHCRVLDGTSDRRRLHDQRQRSLTTTMVGDDDREESALEWDETAHQE